MFLQGKCQKQKIRPKYYLYAKSIKNRLKKLKRDVEGISIMTSGYV
jgi:hypothetical protein